MAEGQDGQEKTEEPTEKRRLDARKDGQIVTSKEVFVLTSLAVGTLAFVLGRSFLSDVAGYWATGLMLEPGVALESLMISRTGDLLLWLLLAGPGLGFPVLLAVVAVQSGVGGLHFAAKALTFKPARIDPLQGLKRMVSMNALVELTKAALKVLLLLGAGLAAVWPMMSTFAAAATVSPGTSIGLLGEALTRLLGGVLTGLTLIAALDLSWQLHSNSKKLKMSRQEIKDEMKEAEGAPEQKAEQRRRQREASQRAAERKALEDVPSANAIITNPTHFAVALRYDTTSGKAPVIVAMGKGPLAQEIIRRGRRATVSTLRIPPLSRALYFNGALGKEIPEALYAAVAIVLAHIWRLDHGMLEPLPAVTLPPGMMLDEFGRQIQRN